MTAEPGRALERFGRSDLRFLIVCAALLAASVAFSVALFDRAFPEASIEFRVDQKSSRAVAETLLDELGYARDGRMHAVRFQHDDDAKIFLERTLGLGKAAGSMRDGVEIWWWTHRWFTPLRTDELRVRVSPRGELVGFERVLEETWAAKGLDPETRVPAALAFLRSAGVDTSGLKLVSVSEKKLPRRIDTVVTFEQPSLRTGGAPYEFAVTLQGGEIGGFTQQLRVPESWTREYVSLRSKNEAANDVASVLLSLTAFAALVVFVVRMRRGDVQLRFSFWIAVVCGLLVFLVSLNSFPADLANYDTKSSFAAFVAEEIGLALFAGIALGLFLMVIAGAGDALQRERLPGQLAIPLLWSRSAFRSRRVFLAFALGFTLVGIFLAYQVAFYLVADSLGAWAPAEIPYDDALNTWLPWAAVLFIGFYPGFSEEYMSRAFSIPFLEKLLHSRMGAIVLSAFVWGFAHSAYPNQPFFIRGLEVGIAGIVLGLVLYRWGLLPLIVWHYTVDALYTSVLLFRSGNPYYVASAALCTFAFAIPMLVSLALYLRRGGFEPDGHLENGAIGTAGSVQPQAEQVRVEPEREGAPLSRRAIAIALAVALAGFALALTMPRPISDLVANALTPSDATSLARRHLESSGVREIPQRSIAFMSAGFRSWNEDRGRGGAPGSYDGVAAVHIANHSPETTHELARVMREEVEAATWKVRFFTPEEKEEYLVEIDPRTRSVIGSTHVVADDAPGPSLEQERALEIASVELRRFGIDEGALDLKDAVAVPQVNRRDWSFHFERKKPIGDDVFQRTDVRVSGNVVTHIGRTVRLSEQARRAATENFGINTVLLFARVVAGMLLFGLIVGGVIVSMRGRELRWRPILRATLLLAAAAAIAEGLRLTLAAREYDTSVAWETFLARQSLASLEGFAFEIFIVFLCVMAIVSRMEGSPGLLSRANRARVGRDAVTRALAAVAGLLALIQIDDALEIVSRVGIDVAPPTEELFAIAFPAIDVGWRGLFIAAWMTALVAGYASFVSSLRRDRQRFAHGIAIACLALLVFDHGARPGEMAWAALQAIVAGAGIFAVAWFLLRENLLAASLVALPWAAVDDVTMWLRSGRTDLVVNAVALSIIIAGVFAWCWKAERRRGAGTAATEQELTEDNQS
ncbi:MAG: lysostaphin resistance A-like protein [Thermoanaerobaculia bacterium]